MNTSRYDIRLTRGEVVVFTGFFFVNNSTNIVETFYDSTNPTVNIRSTGNNGGPTYLYYPGWLCFDGGGVNITSFPYYFGSTPGDYNLYGSTTSSNGLVGGITGSFTYTIILTPTSNSVLSLSRSISMGSLFTNNAQVYYKSHSLSTGSGGSGVRNCRHKQYKT